MGDYIYKDGELYHYGVLGMKWGVRKNPQKAYVKATKHRKKLEEKAIRRQDEAERSGNRLIKKENKVASNLARAYKLDSKAEKLDDKIYKKRTSTAKRVLDEKKIDGAKIRRSESKYDNIIDKHNAKVDRIVEKNDKYMTDLYKSYKETVRKQRKANRALVKYERFSKAMGEVFNEPVVSIKNDKRVRDGAEYVNSLIEYTQKKNGRDWDDFFI